MNALVVICPQCLFPVDEDGRCPRCGATPSQSEWPSITGHDDLSPVLSTGLLPPTSSFEPYQLPTGGIGRNGCLQTALPYRFGDGKSCIRIGGSALQADIIIGGAESLQAALLRHRQTGKWWAYDCGSNGGMQVNGRRVRLHELQMGDRISVDGIALVFLGDRIESNAVRSDGMSISVRNMSFLVAGRRRPILDRVSFSILPGEFVGVLGPSGCGKSSLVQRIIGLSNNYTGDVLVNGNDRRIVEDRFRMATAYLPQNVDQSLHQSLTLAEEIDCFRRLHMSRGPHDDVENASCLDAVGLTGRESSTIGQLSGGEKRRAGIALALLRNPKLMLLDEPGAGLDPASERTLMQHLRGVADQGRTVLCVTHILGNAALFDKVLVLSQGKVAYFGPPGEVLTAFHVNDWSQLYQALEHGAVVPNTQRATPDNTKAEIPCAAKKPSFFGVVRAYLFRFWKEFLKTKRGSSGELFSWMLSQPSVYWLWQPLGLVIGLRIACAYYFQSDTNGTALNDVEMLGFCASLSTFWIGINNSARDFVRERVPGRCLEMLDGVSYSAYVLSRISWMMFLCTIETLSFVVLLYLAGCIPVPLVENSFAVTLHISLLWLFPLLVTGLIGGLCGLAVSSVAKCEIGAVTIIPNIAILALLFSNSVVRFEDGSGGYVAIARTISETIMPCHWTSKVVAALQNGDSLSPGLGNLIKQFAAYALLTLAVILNSQKRNEKQWDGR